MKHQYKLSICMMVKDEEKNLKRCLDNLIPLLKDDLAEVIIVDTGSIDKTVDIAKEYTDKIYYHKWNNNFSDMRNISISYASGEWVFIIDADERLDNVDDLVSLMKSGIDPKYNTILLQIKNLYNYKDENRYNLLPSPRIFRYSEDLKYVGSVHNQPIFKGENLNADIYITHFGYISSDKALMEKKFIRTTTLLKSELEKSPENLYYLFQLGTSYDMHGDVREGYEQFGKAYTLLMDKNKDTKEFFSYIFAAYTRSTYGMNKFDEAVKIGLEAIDLRPEYIDAYYLVALSYKRMGNDDKANQYFGKYIELANKYNELDISKDLSVIMYHIDKVSLSNAYFEIYQYYFNCSEYDIAYKNALLVTNKSQQIFSRINILLKLNKLSELKDFYNSLEDDKNRKTFLNTFEAEIKKLEEENINEVYREFESEDSLYGLFNKIKLASGEDKVLLSKKLIQLADFDKEPLFYSEVLINLKGYLKDIIGLFKKLEITTIRNIANFLIEKDDTFIGVFEDYCLNTSIRTSDLQGNRVITAISMVLLVKNIENSGIIDDKYLELYKSYIEKGINLTAELYQLQKARIIYKSVNNPEDRFFILMHIVNESVQAGNVKVAIKFISEAINTYEVMVKYMDVYKDQLLKIDGEDSYNE